MFATGTTNATESSSLYSVDSRAGRIPPDLALFLCAIFCLSVQIQLPGSSETFDTRIAPSDLFLALTLVVCPSLLRIRRRIIDLLPLAMLITLAIGVLIALLRVGNVTTHSILVKFGGGLVLALLAIVTASYVRDGWTDQILRTFIVGMAFWSVVAYLDWKVVDLLPFVEAKTPTRFGGMQFDPNNAGVGYGATLLLIWKLAPRLFSRRASKLLITCVLAVALALTLSRGGYVATAAAAVFVLFVERPSAQRLIRLGGSAMVLVVVAVLSGVLDAAVHDFGRRPDNVSGRTELANDGFSDFVASRGTGIGLGTYRAEYEQIIHNTALWLIVEMSLAGLALLLAVVVIPARVGLTLSRRDTALGAGLLGAHAVFVVGSMNIEALYQRPWWMVIGVLAGALSVTDRENWARPPGRTRSRDV